jgi:hypothetical protein
MVAPGRSSMRVASLTHALFCVRAMVVMSKRLPIVSQPSPQPSRWSPALLLSPPGRALHLDVRLRLARHRLQSKQEDDPMSQYVDVESGEIIDLKQFRREHYGELMGVLGLLVALVLWMWVS